jgi:hypothetical protein
LSKTKGLEVKLKLKELQDINYNGGTTLPAGSATTIIAACKTSVTVVTPGKAEIHALINKS